ncbi:MAG: PDZ domain-containing protein [Myxococcales bacterium]|nr:PDZ domain-containing protein [Myxococcales bacterium]
MTGTHDGRRRRPACAAGAWLKAGLISVALLHALPGLTACAILGGGEETGGVFMRLGYAESTGLRVADVPEGPAREAGLREDDRVTRIDGDDVSRMPMREIVERLRGPVGSTVELEVVRDGEFHTFVVRRAAYEREGR